MKYEYTGPKATSTGTLETVRLTEKPVCPGCGTSDPYSDSAVQRKYVDYLEDTGEPIEIEASTRKFECRECVRVWTETETFKRTPYTYNFLWHLLKDYTAGTDVDELIDKYKTGAASLPRLLIRYGENLDKLGTRNYPETVLVVPYWVKGTKVFAVVDPVCFRLLDVLDRYNTQADKLAGKNVILAGSTGLPEAANKVGTGVKVLPFFQLENALKEDLHRSGKFDNDYRKKVLKLSDFDEIYKDLDYIRFAPVIEMLKKKDLEELRKMKPVPGLKSFNQALEAIKSFPQEAHIVEENGYAEAVFRAERFLDKIVEDHKGKLSFPLFRAMALYGSNPLAQALPLVYRKNPRFRFYRQL